MFFTFLMSSILISSLQVFPVCDIKITPSPTALHRFCLQFTYVFVRNQFLPYFLQLPTTPAEKYKGSVLGRTHAKESFTSILFIRAIKTRPPEPLPLKLHARSLWFFICFRRPYAPCLYISPPGCSGRYAAGQGAGWAKASPKTLSQCRRLAAVF